MAAAPLRFEDATAWAVIALGLFALVLALILGMQTYASRSEQARAEATERRPAEAVLLEPAVAHPTPGGWSPPEPVPAAWVDVQGRERIGAVTIDPPLPAGARVPIWVDAAGKAVSAPGNRATALVAAATTGAASCSGPWSSSGGLCLAVRRTVDACNAEAWARQWAVVEPRWSGRSPTTPGPSPTTDS